uniref:DH domain-containing protein n=1 Tax=Meloidogyne hapla TaxID=6305 RepID=A0A1I8BQ03_MELHA
MDKISRKQRQIERKVENLKRLGAEEEKFKASPSIRPVTKTTLKTSTNGSSSENRTSSSKASETLKRDEEEKEEKEEEKVSETETKHKTKIIKKKIIKTSNPTNGVNKKEDKSELTKPTIIKKENEQSDADKIENVPRTYQIVIILSDYLHEGEEGDEEEPFTLDEGQCVEVLDSTNPTAWLVRTKTKPPSIGFAPGSYFTSPTKYYALQKETCSIAKVLQTEEEFIGELKLALDYYVKAIGSEDNETKEVPQAVQDKSKQLLVENMKFIHDFHSNKFINTIKECSDDPGIFAKSFINLEKDFKEIHLSFMRELDNALRLCQHVDIINKFLEELINKKINCNEEMKKSLNYIQLLEQRAKEPDFTKQIVGYSGDIDSLGNIYRNEVFQVWEDGESNTELGNKHIFLFNNIILITDKEENNGDVSFKHYATIKLNEYSTIRQHSAEPSTLVVAPNVVDSNKNLPTYLLRIRRENPEESEIVRRVWINDICQMQRAIGG